MKLSTKSKIGIWAIFFVTLIIVFTIVISLYKVDIFHKTKLSVDKYSTYKLYLNESDVSNIHLNDILNIRIGDTFKQVHVKEINFDNLKNLYFVTLQEHDLRLIPNSVVDVSLITGHTTLLNELFSSV